MKGHGRGTDRRCPFGMMGRFNGLAMVWPAQPCRSPAVGTVGLVGGADRKSTRLNSSHLGISYAVFCLKKERHVTQDLGIAGIVQVRMVFALERSRGVDSAVQKFVTVRHVVASES